MCRPSVPPCTLSSRPTSPLASFLRARPLLTSCTPLLSPHCPLTSTATHRCPSRSAHSACHPAGLHAILPASSMMACLIVFVLLSACEPVYLIRCSPVSLPDPLCLHLSISSHYSLPIPALPAPLSTKLLPPLPPPSDSGSAAKRLLSCSGPTQRRSSNRVTWASTCC